MVRKQFIALLYGWIVVFGLLIFSSIILALLLRFTSFHSNLTWLTFGIGLAILFSGGFFAGIKSKQRGWLIGCLTGIGFSLFIFIVQYLGYQQPFHATQMLHHMLLIIASMFGGVIGVNVFAKKHA